MRVLVACEESQRVCTAFRERGHIAYSCDVQEPSGGHPEWHILGDVLEVLDGGGFDTMDGSSRYVQSWDLIIAHPPCTYLTAAGACRMYPHKGQIDPERYAKAMDARRFFMRMYNAPCERVCVENPRPLKVCELPPPTQVIQPYEYGHPYSKATCLWLRGLPPLRPTKIIKDYEPYVCTGSGKPGVSRAGGAAKTRSKTFEGIAQAMAEQWGGTDI